MEPGSSIPQPESGEQQNDENRLFEEVSRWLGDNDSVRSQLQATRGSGPVCLDIQQALDLESFLPNYRDHEKLLNGCLHVVAGQPDVVQHNRHNLKLAFYSLQTPTKVCEVSSALTDNGAALIAVQAMLTTAERAVVGIEEAAFCCGNCGAVAYPNSRSPQVGYTKKHRCVTCRALHWKLQPLRASTKMWLTLQEVHTNANLGQTASTIKALVDDFWCKSGLQLGRVYTFIGLPMVEKTNGPSTMGFTQVGMPNNKMFIADEVSRQLPKADKSCLRAALRVTCIVANSHPSLSPLGKPCEVPIHQQVAVEGLAPPQREVGPNYSLDVAHVQDSSKYVWFWTRSLLLKCAAIMQINTNLEETAQQVQFYESALVTCPSLQVAEKGILHILKGIDDQQGQRIVMDKVAYIHRLGCRRLQRAYRGEVPSTDMDHQIHVTESLTAIYNAIHFGPDPIPPPPDTLNEYHSGIAVPSEVNRQKKFEEVEHEFLTNSNFLQRLRQKCAAQNTNEMAIDSHTDNRPTDGSTGTMGSTGGTTTSSSNTTSCTTSTALPSPTPSVVRGSSKLDIELLQTLGASRAVLDFTAEFQNVRQWLTQVLIPAFCGDVCFEAYAKLLLLTQLVGGTTVDDTLQNIHVLLVGPPHTAKTHLAVDGQREFASAICTGGATYIQGQMTTVPGFTVSAAVDSTARVHVGATVIAHEGVLIIDDLHTLPLECHGALFESMAQGTVSVTKSNIRGSHKANSAVLATIAVMDCVNDYPTNNNTNNSTTSSYAQQQYFNPGYNYDEPLQRNIGLSEALISRFDGVAVLSGGVYQSPFDSFNKEKLTCAERIDELVAHMTSKLHVQDQDQDERDIQESTSREHTMVQYLRLVRNIQPVVAVDSFRALGNSYTQTRKYSKHNNKPQVSLRVLKAAVKLSEAVAKLCCSEQVTDEHVEIATEICQNTHRIVVGDPNFRRM